MKIFSADQIRSHDAYTILHEPIASIDLMERAASRLTQWVMAFIPKDKPLTLFCGTGNNGGDGLVCARLLWQQGYALSAFVLKLSDTPSRDFEINLRRLIESGVQPTDLNSINDVPAMSDGGVVIDAIFGTGLSRPIEGLAAQIIEQINASGATVVAVDLPSGLRADASSPGAVINATHTLTFQLPKLAFFMPENARHVGEWHLVDIGLHEAFYNETVTNTFLTTESDAAHIYKARQRFSHKGTFGHALMVTGSKGMMGAAVLTTKAALRSGSGLVTAFVPQVGYQIMQESLPEAMTLTASSEEFISGSPFAGQDPGKYSALGIGPGMGTAGPTRQALARLLDHLKKPMVIDADALNIIALEHWLDKLPPGVILTPHPGEFKRLAGESENDFAMLERQRELSEQHGVLIMLKRAYTCITLPDGSAHFNSSGSPALATGGSGDVLTGILTGLLAQGYSPDEATRLGAWLHGKAGELAAEESSDEAVIAGDIVEHLGGAFKSLQSGEHR
jgi:NAD(P)H-hydrate epimerase